MNEFFDYDCNSPLFSISNNMAVDMKGRMHWKIAQNLAVDTQTGQAHFTMPWALEKNNGQNRQK